MPRKPRTQAATLPTIAPELLESFGDGPMTAEAINVGFPHPSGQIRWHDHAWRAK